MTDTAFISSPEAPGEQDADFETALAVAASPDAVFEALTTPAGLSRWWGQAAGSGLAGGELTVRFDGETRFVLRVDAAERPTTVSWTTLDSAHHEWPGTTIRFDVAPAGQGGARLHFRHAGLTPRLECYDDCSLGWDYFLRRLAACLDAGA